MFGKKPEVRLHPSWQDERVRSTAALLDYPFGADELIDIEKASEYLASYAVQYGLSPEEIHRALAEHEPILGFQEQDTVLLGPAPHSLDL